MEKNLILSDQEFGILEKWGKLAIQSGILPQGTNPAQAMIIIQAGKEMGLEPTQSLRSMNFIKGRLTMSVQLQLALAKRLGVRIKELHEKENECVVTLVREDEKITCTYTMDDAERAGLLKPEGNYYKYPKQMLRWRAIGDALRIIAPDFVMGILSPEEAESIELEKIESIKSKKIENIEPEKIELEVEKVNIESQKQEQIEYITEEERKELFALLKAQSIEPIRLQQFLQKKYCVDKTALIPKSELENIKNQIMEMKKEKSFEQELWVDIQEEDRQRKINSIKENQQRLNELEVDPFVIKQIFASEGIKEGLDKANDEQLEKVEKLLKQLVEEKEKSFEEEQKEIEDLFEEEKNAD
ncbi:MAG: hypothetical protein AB1397_01765 [bacterium]